MNRSAHDDHFSLFPVICSQFPVTGTHYNSNLFSISPEGSSYRESTVLVSHGAMCLFPVVACSLRSRPKYYEQRL